MYKLLISVLLNFLKAKWNIVLNITALKKHLTTGNPLWKSAYAKGYAECIPGASMSALLMLHQEWPGPFVF